ncbi:MAG: glycosyltransferase family 2 protein, partial [Candidatus Uhrbacteria bacterium]|nr:glycosyltransferase family 2 protein [Candidatus Uhrbacteria bacterium]
MSKRFGQYGRFRGLEMIPALIVWSTLLLATLAAFFAPTLAIIFIIVFDLYWMLRVFYFVIHVIAAYREYRKSIATDWYSALKKLPNWERLYHVVMLPTYKEPLEIIEESINALLRGPYRTDRMIIVLGGEERDQENFNRYAETLRGLYADRFAGFVTTVHPADQPGEIPGKGSNMRHMAFALKAFIDERSLPYDDVIVSAFDIDTVAHAQYFARLAYLYLTVPNPTRTSFQPVTVFSNNIWSAAAPVRIAAFGTTFWLLSELVRPERMWTFSSHSMPWRMLVDVGFWEPDLVSEDSRIFMQAFLHYNGDYRVTPVFLPVSLDAVAGGHYIESLVALYKQQRRWAWGVEHFPYMVTEFRKHPALAKRKKIWYLFNHLEGMYTWAAAPFLIFLLGYLPFLTVGDAESALVVNSPYTLEVMMRLATFGVFITGALSLFLLPPRPQKTTSWAWLVMIGQWALLPVTFILFGALPALDAQTRFMLGKYLG